MLEKSAMLPDRLRDTLGDLALNIIEAPTGVTAEVAAASWVECCRLARDELGFEQLIDLCGVDYLSYGEDEWDTDDATSETFSRGIEGDGGPGRFDWAGRPTNVSGQRFAVVAHLLSISNNERLRLRCKVPDDEVPAVASLVDTWPSANWFEREAFDLFGIIFEGHPDLRRLLTDYGFIGHPFRKDFPLIGNVEVRYDPEKGRVIYQPVSIEPRVLVPKVIRSDSRYGQQGAKGGSRG
ncbi:MAG: NADH-quinone oxidoreductase subunit C [Pseudomonadota bacterium]